MSTETARIVSRSDRSVANDRVEWLIDNAAAYDRLLAAIARARRSIWIAQLALDADCVSHPSTDLADDDAVPVAAFAGRGIAEMLVQATSTKAVEARILLNATLLLDTAAPLRRFFAAAGAERIRVRGISRFPQLLHAKFAIIDGRAAFLMGSPFANGYWDDARHCPTDIRRPARELAGRPVHDLSVRITGPAVHDLESIFTNLWNDAAVGVRGDDEVLRARRAPPPIDARSGALRIVRTAPRRVLPALADGATEILDACLAGIARARRLIYIEHQYLSARPIVAALARALAREPALELVMVLNQNPDVTAYRGWQNARLAEAGWLAHPRVGAFALWTAAPSRERAGVTAINQLFVHSKVLLVDDDWATAGSANLDGVSLHSYGDDFAGSVARRVFRHVRNIDVNVVLHAGIPGARRKGAVADLRARLWAEHLGAPIATLATGRAPAGGWLRRWREAAAHNVTTLNAADGTSAAMTGFVLPYSVRSTPAAQLADVGVRLDPARLDLRFDPGWLEVTCSPTWVRNMFL